LLFHLTTLFRDYNRNSTVVIIAIALPGNGVRRRVDDELSERYLVIAKGDPFMFDNIDSFVVQSRENTFGQGVILFPFDSDAGYYVTYEFWDKVGQIVANLTELKSINISFAPYDDDDEDDNSPDWEILTRILRHLQRKVKLYFCTKDYDAEVEEIQGLARAIHGHPMISEFSSEMEFTFENLGPWCSALATLPCLERVRLGLQEPETEVNPEPLTELLRTPALRSVEFDDFYFTDALCNAVAKALEEESPVADITFHFNCFFLDGGRAIIANALKTNASVTNVEFYGRFDEVFLNSLAAVLLFNSTLQNLIVHSTTRAISRWFSSIFLSLGMNTTLKCLTVSIFDKFGDKQCAAIRNGLAKNSTLEELVLHNLLPSSDDGAISARNALSFLLANSTLKSLTVSFGAVQSRQESHDSAFRLQAQKKALGVYVSAIRLEAVKMLEKNPFLESLTIITNWHSIKFEELFSLVSALQLNTTLKTLCCQISPKSLYLSDDEMKHLVSILMKNYGLECLVPDIRCADDRIIKAILRLNGAGRRYLIKDGSSVSKGVEVLSAVNDDINCLFLHLLENPGLCDRRAVKTETTRIRRPGDILDESSSCGKRERAQSQPDREPRRRPL
jgi:hypothetical protein